eukprot:387913-Rhodomonas_salina.1
MGHVGGFRWPCVFWALQYGHYPFVERVLELGAGGDTRLVGVDARLADGETLLMRATLSDDQQGAQLLLRRGASLNATGAFPRRFAGVPLRSLCVSSE